MRCAVIADIHGNADALEAVLDDIAAHRADEIVNLGDCFSGPLDAARTWQILRRAGISLTVRGNHDRHLIETPPAAMGPSDAEAHRQLPPEALDWLQCLPGTAAAGDLLLLHGTPEDDDVYLLHEPLAGGLRDRTPGEVAAILGACAQEIVLCGHSHLPRAVALPNGRLVVNPGSVGCPAYTDETPVPHAVSSGTPNASWALVEGRSVTFRLVPYDAGAMIERAYAAGRTDWVEALETGWLAL